ncbi:competence protein ComA [Desulfosporosinus sp. BG]|uniref:competence protein ComA n=1 Tax=Desulfosporosinus sp. BG TaxID=1633135 RepID=UPI00083B48EC|nr:competence protein ComA [Desulfosporosinus sp. BG]ODA41719.1 Type IV pilus biogenesis protein PilM [Desulfosporosinus sp. BG]
MRKRSVVFELTDAEIRAFWFSAPLFRNPGHSSANVKFDCIPIPAGVIEQGNVRNENVLSDILTSYRAQHLGESQIAYLAIPLQQGFIRSYSLPWIPKRDRKSAISLLIDEEISIVRSDLLFDFLVLSEEKHKNLQVLLGATRQSLLERYVFILDQAGFKVKGVDFSFSILGQALGFEPNEGVLYLQGAFDSVQMALFRGTVPENVRSLPSLERTLSLSSTEKNEGRVAVQPEEWAKEIRRFLLYYRTQHQDLELRRLVWSGDSVVEVLALGLLASNHVSTVEKAKLRNVPGSWQEVFEGISSWGEVAVGYGIRISAHLPVLNLWRQPSRAQTVQRRYHRMALLLLVLFMIGTIIWFSLCQMALPLQEEVQLLSREGTEIVAQAKDQKDLEIAWHKVMHSTRVGAGLAQIQGLQVLAGTELKIEQVVYKQGSMSLSGSAKEARSVETLIRTLRTMGWEQPTLTRYKLTTVNNVEFSLSAKRGQAGTEPVNTIENSAENTLTNTGASLEEEG